MGDLARGAEEGEQVHQPPDDPPLEGGSPTTSPLAARPRRPVDPERHHGDAAAMNGALNRFSDLVLLVDGDTTITWVNDAVHQVLGHRRDEVVGRSLADFVHPEDLDRAAQLIALVTAGAFGEAPITSALYRVADAQGRWVDMDVNAAATSGSGDGELLVIGRPGGDLVLTGQLLEAVTSGETVECQADIVMAMGVWRYPSEGYVVQYRNDDGRLEVRTTGAPGELTGEVTVDGPTPWEAARSMADLVTVELADGPHDPELISDELVAIARAAGFTGCVAAAVPDPLHAEGAAIVIWTTPAGPLGSGRHYGLGNMRRALTLVLQQRSQRQMLERAARVDELTGVTSRSWFLERLDAVADDSGDAGRHGLLYVDLDGFKTVNDALGHHAGDHVLAEAALRITQVAPPEAVVARLGGDEFVVLCAPGTDETSLVALAEAVVGQLARPILIGDQPRVIGASVGAALGAPGQDPRTVLHAADAALFRAKARGRNRWHLATVEP